LSPLSGWSHPTSAGLWL